MEKEKIEYLPLSEVHTFSNHPFQVNEDEKMYETVASISELGVLTPGVARKRPEGGYEIISGHRRHRASVLAGLTEMPFIVRELDDETATIMMVDSNLQRDSLLPSERAFSYKLKVDAIKRRGGKGISDSSGKNRVTEEVAKAANTSRASVQRFLRLTELTPNMLSLVDDGKISVNAGVHLSYLDAKSQDLVLSVIEYHEIFPNIEQAKCIRTNSDDGILTYEGIGQILTETAQKDCLSVTLNEEKLLRFFPKSYTPLQMEKIIEQLLQRWQKQQQKRPPER